jgi:hypothetical protein
MTTTNLSRVSHGRQSSFNKGGLPMKNQIVENRAVDLAHKILTNNLVILSGGSLLALVIIIFAG